jgi:hypothetical protein
MLSALVRIQVKNDQDTPSIVPVIKTKKPRKQRETKKKKEVQNAEADDTLEYSKFVPLKTKDKAPLSYEEDDGDDGLFAAVAKGDDDDEFEDENDMYTKQDLEWAELMKEATAIDEDESDASSSLGDSSPSVTQSHIDEDDPLSMSLSEMSVEGSPYHDDDCDDTGNTYGAKDEDSFFSYARKGKEKPIKKYTGIVIVEDDDFIP